ncbi:MAG: hypothetical protein HWE07_04650 [Cytophagia bacterium]|nr:hypothetical protein [Cytophagia bacterium]
MEQKLMLKESVMKLVKDEFNTNETLTILRSNPSIFMSWGVETLFDVNGKGLMMKVNGHHHKEWVLITLGWDDYYRVHIITKFGEVLDSYEGVCFDELVRTIDDSIEWVDEYEF